jgi:hypothetical protein
LDWVPSELLVTLKITVQLPLAGMVIPLKLRDVAPAVRDAGLAPHVPVTVPPFALMFVKVSVNVPLVSWEEVELAIVKVSVEVPPD